MRLRTQRRRAPAAARSPRPRFATATSAPSTTSREKAGTGGTAARSPLSLERARLLGHRPENISFAPRSAVQRKAYLANSDENIYKDTQQTDLELAYLGKAGERPVFADYKKVMDEVGTIQSWWMFEFSKNLYGNQIDTWTTVHFYPNLAKRDPNVGKTYFETTEGELDEVDLGAENLAARMAAVAANGPLYLNVGGGSRLPKAEGRIFARSGTKNDVLTLLGVAPEDFGKYDGVEFRRLLGKRPRYVEGKLYRSYFDYLKVLCLASSEGNTFAGDDFFYISTVVPTRSANSRVRAQGKVYADDFSDTFSLDPLDESFQGLREPASSGWRPGSELTTVDRGKGQVPAMDGWNALGAAAFANARYGKKLDLDQNWEWLHLEGAQIGGATKGGNLTPGLFAVNSEMIPYENLIAQWANAAPTKMWARFRPEGTWYSFTGRIVLEVKAEEHPMLGTTGTPLQVAFDPMKGKVVDKLAGKIRARDLDLQEFNV